MIQIAAENLSRVGNTPLLEVRGLSPALSGAIRLFAKAEWLNPGGSVKDRAALKMVREGERTLALHPGKTLLDATSGNTGIAYAWLGARLGYKVKLCVPASINEDRKRVLLAYGAELVLTSPLEGSDGAILEARQLHAADPAAYFYPDQYSNEANWRAHFESTGPEIWEQTAGRVTHFVCGLGTAGTFTGAGRFLRDCNRAVRLISVEPDAAFHGIEGLKHMATAIVPAIYDGSLADENRAVSTEEAQRMARRLALECGLLVGVSSGANVAAALAVCEELARAGESAVVATVFPDSGERYLGERFWRDGAG